MRIKLQPKHLYAAVVVLATTAIIGASVAGFVKWESVVSAMLALLGTFLGALFAFRLNEEKEKKQAYRNRVASLNRALFVLGRQRNAIQNLVGWLAPYKGEVERALNLPAFQPPSYVGLTQNVDDLQFLLELENPQLLLSITVEQERFEQAIETLRLRNNFYVGEVQPVLSAQALSGRSVTLDQLKAALGERLFVGAVEGAKNVYEHVEASEKSLAEMQKELEAFARATFPNERFITYQ